MRKLQYNLLISAAAICFLTISGAVLAQSSGFERIGTGQGLLQSLITVIHQDQNGFLWVGTSDGLCRYDGYQFITYRFDPFDPAAISGNYIEAIFESNGRLWIRTSGGGINYYDPATAGFEHFYHDAQDVNSLSHDEVNCVLQDRQGNIWLATGGGGLNLFNPHARNFVRIENIGPDKHRLMSNNVVKIFEDDHGKLWFGTAAGLSCLARPPAELWDLLLHRPAGQQFPLNFKHWQQSSSGLVSLSDNLVTDIFQDVNSNLWVATANGLNRIMLADSLNQLTVYLHHPEDSATISGNRISEIFPAYADSLIWVKTAGGDLDLVNIHTGLADQVSLQNNYPPVKVDRLLIDSRGKQWFTTLENGLGCFQSVKNGRTVTLQNFNSNKPDAGITDDHITAIFEDRSGIIWVGTQRAGLHKLNLRKRKFRHLRREPDQNRGLSSNLITAILADDSNQVWIGTANAGLNVLRRQPGKNERITHLRHQPGTIHSLASDQITALFQDRRSNIWIGTNGAGLNRYQPRSGKFQHFTHDPQNSNSLSGNIINTIYEDQYGQMWIGTRTGLAKLDKFTGKITRYPHRSDDVNSLSHDDVWAIYEDYHSNGRTLWIGTRGGGLNRFDRNNQQFVRYTREFDNPTSLNNPAILSIFQDTAGNLWFGTYSGGLNQFNRISEEFSYFTERDGLASNMIFGILEDRQNHLWLSTNKGLSRFNPASIDSLQRPFVQNYDVYDGLQANEFTPNAYAKTADGEMFFGGVNGLTSFYPDSIDDNPFIPPLAITSMQIFDQPASQRMAEAQSRHSAVELSPNENFIAFEFSALDFTNPRKNRYAYRLEGVDEQWVAAGQRRYASYTNLDPGKYRFIVKGSNNDGVWNEAGTSLEIILHPPFWRTWWFYLLVTAILSVIAITIHRYRLRHKIRRLMEIEQIRSQENEKVRAKAAQDFHDELGHKLTKISLFSEILKRNTNGENPDATTYLDRINATAKSLSGGMRDFIWTLDPGKDTLHEVALRLRDFGDDLFDKTGMAFRMEGVGSDLQRVQLDMDWRRHITLIFKEAMNNALKHSRCKNVTLAFSLSGRRIVIALSDDGVGIPQQVLPVADSEDEPDTTITGRGNGVNNMQFRARKIGGKLDIAPGKPGGTLIRLTADIDT